MPVRAYHLTSATHALSDLRNRRLKIATFDDLNDPFELWAVARPNAALRRGLRCWKEQIARTFGVLCFSKTWHNPLLWSHYADRHHGIAFGFDINSDMAKEVTYTQRRPLFNRADELTLHTLLYTKHLESQYEKEIRVFARLDERDAPRSYISVTSMSTWLCARSSRDRSARPRSRRSKLPSAMSSLYHQRTPCLQRTPCFNSFNIVTDKRGFRGT